MINIPVLYHTLWSLFPEHVQSKWTEAEGDITWCCRSIGADVFIFWHQTRTHTTIGFLRGSCQSFMTSRDLRLKGMKVENALSHAIIVTSCSTPTYNLFVPIPVLKCVWHSSGAQGQDVFYWDNTLLTRRESSGRDSYSREAREEFWGSPHWERARCPVGKWTYFVMSYCGNWGQDFDMLPSFFLCLLWYLLICEAYS